jgi:hypothetical protein
MCPFIRVRAIKGLRLTILITNIEDFFINLKSNLPLYLRVKVRQDMAQKNLRRTALFKCLECGKKFYTTSSAEKASLNGCPKCNGLDIDIA